MSLVEEVAALRTIPMFAKVDDAKLRLLAFASDRIRFAAGEALFHQDEEGDAAYILLSGSADIEVASPEGAAVKVAEIGPSDFVGEIAVLCDIPRTATVRATVPTETLVISKDLFFKMVTQFPDVAVEVMRSLAMRLDQTTRDLSVARRRQ